MVDVPNALEPGPKVNPDGTLRFPRRHKVPDEPVSGVVVLLETLLEYARSGEMQGLAVAVVCYFAMNSAIEKLHRARGRYCDGESTTVDGVPGPFAA